jgi:hypothetical protein
VSQTIIFKIEIDFVTAKLAALVLQLQQVEKHFDSAFRNRLCCVWLWKLNLVLQEVGKLGVEKDLVDVHFRPLIYNSLDNVQSFLLSRYTHLTDLLIT